MANGYLTQTIMIKNIIEDISYELHKSLAWTMRVSAPVFVLVGLITITIGLCINSIEVMTMGTLLWLPFTLIQSYNASMDNLNSAILYGKKQTSKVKNETRQEVGTDSQTDSEQKM